jgi:peptide/nickel transport system permease protein
MSSEEEYKKKNQSILKLLIVKLFGGKEKLSIFEEEQIQSPFRTIVKNFVSNKIAMTGVIIFLIIFATVIIGPNFFKQDLSYSETSQQNVAPGMDLLDIPDSLQVNIADISVGPTYSLGVSNEGQLYIWGKTKVTNAIA